MTKPWKKAYLEVGEEDWKARKELKSRRDRLV